MPRLRFREASLRTGQVALRRETASDEGRLCAAPNGRPPEEDPYSLITSLTVIPAGIIGKTCSW